MKSGLRRITIELDYNDNDPMIKFELDGDNGKPDFHDFCLMIAGSLVGGLKDEDATGEEVSKRVSHTIDRIKEMADILIESEV